MESANAVALREEEEEASRSGAGAGEQGGARGGGRAQQAQQSARARNRSQEVRSQWAAETQQVAKDAEEVAQLLGEFSQVIDQQQPMIEELVEANDETVDVLLAGAEEVAESGKAGAAHTHKKVVPSATAAVAGVGAGVATMNPVIGGIAAALGGMVGYGVGSKVSGAISSAIDSELQEARDLVEGDEGHGPLAPTDKLEWMWGDAAIVSAGLAKKNPLNWGSGPATAVLRELQGRPEKEQSRPVDMRWCRAGRDSSASFPTVGAAVRWIERALDPDADAKDEADEPRGLSLLDDDEPEPEPEPSAEPAPAAAGRFSGRAAAEYGRDEHLSRAMHHAELAAQNIAEAAPRLEDQGTAVDRVEQDALKQEGVIAAATRANRKRTVLGALGAGAGGERPSASGSAAAAREKPTWIRSFQSPECMLCEAEWGFRGTQAARQHCR